jgi:hypothetical protein
MGTALTGLEIKDTYDGLVKITDNGPLSATAKLLSDGLGNDSALALSTTLVGVGTASPASRLSVSGTGSTALSKISVTNTNTNATLGLAVSNSIAQAFVGTDTNHPLGLVTNDLERVTITAAGNVGIGTTAPTSGSKLHVVSASSGVVARTDLGGTIIAEGSTRAGLYILTAGTAAGSYGSIWWGNGNLDTDAAIQVNNSTRAMQFVVADAERFRITPNGVTFNGDTAAANALDDYEEGTWTPSISFGGASVGVTLNAANAASYTKIGRQVTVNGYLILTSKGSSAGTARITGLPFTVANTNGTYSAATLRFSNITFANQLQGFANVNTTTIEFEETTEAGVVTNITNADFANDSQIIFSLTYFV